MRLDRRLQMGNDEAEHQRAGYTDSEGGGECVDKRSGVEQAQ